MCGVVDGGIVPGLWGYEAGQSGVGDIFGWFVEHGVPAVRARAGRGARTWACTRSSPRWPPRSPSARTACVALDWHSGNRSVLVDHELSGLLVGPDAGDPARGRLPRADRGDRVRHPHDHRDLRRQRGPGRPSSSSPAACPRTRCSCRSTPTSHDFRCRSSGPSRAPPWALPSMPPSRPARTRTYAPPRRPWARVDGTCTVPDEAAALGLRRAVRRVHRAARPLRPRRQRRHAPAPRDCARGRSPAARRRTDAGSVGAEQRPREHRQRRPRHGAAAALPRCAPCTPSSPATSSWSGPRATSAPACPAAT